LQLSSKYKKEKYHIFIIEKNRYNEKIPCFLSSMFTGNLCAGTGLARDNSAKQAMDAMVVAGKHRKS
jgi:hypothetical protein